MRCMEQAGRMATELKAIHAISEILEPLEYQQRLRVIDFVDNYYQFTIHPKPSAEDYLNSLFHTPTPKETEDMRQGMINENT